MSEINQNSALPTADSTDSVEAPAAQDPIEASAGPSPEDADDNASHDNDDAQPTAAEPEREDLPFDQAYRLTVYYHRKKGQYGVRCEELGDLEVFAASRGEALREGESMLESKMAASAVRGDALPRPYDLDRVHSYSGELNLRISKGLHRDLDQLARHEGVGLDKLIGELLGQGVGYRRHEGRWSRPRQGGDGRQGPEQKNGGRRDDGRGRRGRRHMSPERYSDIMEDKAAFMEYVRGLDGETGSGRGPRGRRRR